MITKEIEKKLKEQEKCTPIREINYYNKKYVMTFKSNIVGIEFKYFEIKNDMIIEETDEKILKDFRTRYEIHEDVIY